MWFLTFHSFFVSLLKFCLSAPFISPILSNNIFQVFLSVISGINMLRGFLIFIIFIWKPSVWRKIVKKHPKLAKVIQVPVQYICCSKPVQDDSAENIPMQPLQSKTDNTLKLSVRFAKKEGETVNCEWNKDYFWVGKGKCDSYPDESVSFAIII